MSSSEPEPQESQPLLRGCHEIQTPGAPFTRLPKVQLVVLGIARLSDPIASTQILPYINEFLATLQVADPSKVGYYSGLVVCGYTCANSSQLKQGRTGFNCIRRGIDHNFSMGKVLGYVKARESLGLD
jgi:hypothetical protein